MEEWKDIKCCDGIYMISSCGRVMRKETGKILTNYDDGHGYQEVMLCFSGKRYSVKVHRLVADAFIENPYNKKCVNHIDYDKTNNNVNNLEWVTYSENNVHSLCNRPQFNNSTTNTGERYITVSKNTYRVTVKRKERRFKTLDEAIVYRNEELKRCLVQ